MGYPKFLIENEFLFNAAVFLGQQVKKVLAPFQIASYLKNHTVKKVQIGSGKHNLAGWLNMDILPFPGIVYINVLKRLPFEDGAFDYVFSEHVISIFTYEQALGWMSECRRILKPGFPEILPNAPPKPRQFFQLEESNGASAQDLPWF